MNTGDAQGSSFVMARLPGRDLAGVARWRADSGLGNLLFPWARSVVAAERFDTGMIWPTWPQIALPQLVRREPPRFYSDLFYPSPARYKSGLEKLRLLALAKRLPEQLLTDSSRLAEPNTIYEFAGMSGYFSDMLGEHELVKARLLEMTKPRHIERARSGIAQVAVHVRRGDFSVPESAQELRSPTVNINLRLPIEWYVHVVRVLRRALGETVPVAIFSDGKDGELAPLLELESTYREGGQSPLSDLLSLADAGILVASGSTFSMWASYLGRMPVIWYPGRIRQRLYHESPWAEIEIGQGEAPGPDFVDCIRRGYLTGTHVGKLGKTGKQTG